MTHTQRKHTMVSSPLLFSLCCLSPLCTHAISFQDILDQSQHSSLLSLEKDVIPFNNPFTAKQESVSIPWQTITLSFPILPENVSTIQHELHLSNVPIYLSYLEYILLQEKRHQHAISLSILPQFFYRSLPNNPSKVSIETALKTPLPLIRPIEESSLVEELLGANVIYPSDLNALETNTALLTSDCHYTPSTQPALSLAIDKQMLPSGTLHVLLTPSLKQKPTTVVSETSFATQTTQPSSEQTQASEALPQLTSNYPLLEETPAKLYDFTTKEVAAPMGGLVPAPEITSSDMIPLSHHYPYSPDLNILFTSKMEQEKPLILSSHKAIREPFKEIPIQPFSLCLMTQETPTSLVTAFTLRSAEGLTRQISHPPELTTSHLPKYTHLTPPASTFSQILHLAEDSLRLQQHLSPSLEPYTEWCGHRTAFVPGIAGVYIGSTLAFHHSQEIDFSTRYVHSIHLLVDKSSLFSDPYNSAPLVSYIAHKARPAPAHVSITPPVAGRFVPKEQETTLNIPITLSPASFAHLMDTSSDPSEALSIPECKNIQALYTRGELIVSPFADELLCDRMLSPYLMTDLEKIYPMVPLINIESMLFGSVVPEIERSSFSKTVDYPFLQEFYSQLASDINPFLFSFEWSSFALSKTMPLTRDKTSCTPAVTLEGVLALLESVGNNQVIHGTYEPNTELLASFTPDHEPFIQHAFVATETPDPKYFTVYTGLNHNMMFTRPPRLDSLEYTHTLALDTEKATFLLPESALSSDLESLQQQCACSVSHDVELHQDTRPLSEVSNFLAYSKLCEATLTHYSLATDKNTINMTSHTPKLAGNSHLSPSLVSSKIDLCPSRKNAALLNQSSRSIQENLAQLPTLQDLRTLSLSEDFSVDVQISQNSKGPGYLFSVTLEPTLANFSAGSAQNFIFLVDRSSSIDKNRLQIFKQAVNKALPYLKEEDTFNVLSFDTEISKMSHESVSVNSASKHGARRFLESQKRGYKYVPPNLYAVLMHVHEMVKDSPLPTTVVLLTNGKSLENFNTQDERLARLISTNKNGFTLFTACSSQNNNTLMLEILSNLNRGEFLHSQTNAAFPRKLAAFVKHAGSLIAKDIHISAAKTDPSLTIEFFPDTSLAPNLYGDRPYTIVGKIDKLSDFDLVLQGRFCDNWLNVTKKISFKTARHGGHSIYKDYTMHVAYNKYREFLQEGNTASLDEAKKVLQPFNTSLPY